MKLDLSPGPVVSSHRHHAWMVEARELLRLAVPLAATQLAQMVILATDTAMLGHLSKEALAAATLGNTIFFSCWLLGSGPPQAVAPVIAHIKGFHAEAKRPRDRRPVRHAARMGLWWAALLTLPLVVVLYFTKDILLAFRQQPDLAANAAVYTSALGFGLPFALAFQALRSFSTALNRPLGPMLVMGLAVLFNAACDYALIFGHFGLPRLGLYGAGLASGLSNCFRFAAMLAIVLMTPGQREYHLLRHFFRVDGAKLKELFRLGMPISVTMIFEVALFNGAALAMGLIDLATLAAHQIAITLPSLTFMIPLGIGLAATVRVGLAAGAGDAREARRAGFTAMGIAILFMSVTALVLLLFPRPIASLWLPDVPENRAVLDLAVTFLHVAAAFQLADGIQVTAAMALRGLKDAEAPMWIAGAAYWLVGAPVGLALGFGFHLAGFGIWLGLAAGLFSAAALLTARFAYLSKAQKN